MAKHSLSMHKVVGSGPSRGRGGLKVQNNFNSSCTNTEQKQVGMAPEVQEKPLVLFHCPLL